MDSSSPIGINVPNWLLRHQLTVSTEESTMKISRVGVDLAKNVFQLHGVDRHGETVLKRRLSRDKWIRVLVNSAEPGCEIGMEACGGAHHWARLLMKKGFRVKQQDFRVNRWKLRQVCRSGQHNQRGCLLSIGR